MSKKLPKVLLVLSIFLVSIFTVWALTKENVLGRITVTENGAAEHGSYELSIEDFESEEAPSGMVGKIILETDAGYYVSDLSVSFEDEELQLGFVAGSYQGGFFRHYIFTPHENEYQFIIPEELEESEKNIQVSVTYEERAPIDVSYLIYEGDPNDWDAIIDVSNYANDSLLVQGYQEGDIILPEDCTTNGCALKFQFDNETDYNNYVDTKTFRDEPNEENGFYQSPWLYADGFYEPEEGMGENTLITDTEAACDDENYVCYIAVTKNFRNISVGKIVVGYTTFNLYDNGSIGFTVESDVPNFNDLLGELGGASIAFNEAKSSQNITIFYGTKHLTLYPAIPNPIVQDGNEQYMGSVAEFDNVTGSGYGYNVVTGSDGEVIINIDTYYQDLLNVELTVTNEGQNLFSKPINIELHRIAFGGNGAELLEVDELGRNCHEGNNGNTCNEGVYYSTQYRGVLSAFYVADDADMEQIGSTQVDSVTNDTICVSDEGDRDAFARDKSFTPHAIALLYNADGMIVETKDFDLNEMVLNEGFVSKNTFEDIYRGFNVEGTIGADKFVYLDNHNRTNINNIEYFDRHIEGTIMFDLVLIGKDEALEKGIKQIAVFLINGPLEEGDTPKLTYGMGEGVVMQIRDYFDGGGE